MNETIRQELRKCIWEYFNDIEGQEDALADTDGVLGAIEKFFTTISDADRDFVDRAAIAALAALVASPGITGIDFPKAFKMDAVLLEIGFALMAYQLADAMLAERKRREGKPLLADTILEDEILSFESNVDVALSEINARTEIEVSD